MCLFLCERLKKNHKKLYLSVQCLEQPNEFGRHIDTRFHFEPFMFMKIIFFTSSPALFASHSVSNNNNNNNTHVCHLGDLNYTMS